MWSENSNNVDIVQVREDFAKDMQLTEEEKEAFAGYYWKVIGIAILLVYIVLFLLIAIQTLLGLIIRRRAQGLK